MRRSSHKAAKKHDEMNESQSQGVKVGTTLKYNTYANILASTISTLDTPATIGIFAGWGSGKSYLMHKIHGKYDTRDSVALKLHDFSIVRRSRRWKYVYRLMRV